MNSVPFRVMERYGSRPSSLGFNSGPDQLRPWSFERYKRVISRIFPPPTCSPENTTSNSSPEGSCTIEGL